MPQMTLAINRTIPMMASQMRPFTTKPNTPKMMARMIKTIMSAPMPSTVRTRSRVEQGVDFAFIEE
ncbi:MAG: hypothetical protein JWQ47_1743 [Glaciihabitans sp.]|nr:hypothetical protein [Glaciihabitans sp.]